MAAPKFTPQVAGEYTGLFLTCVPRKERLDEIDAIGSRIITNQARYEAAGGSVVPWIVVALLHLMECELSFNRHLHNGDPLGAKTVNVPKGRPAGRGPWTWEESAVDALEYDELDTWGDWTAAGMLYVMERYNGWGYRLYHPDVPSPYLWAGSQHYSRGKYIADKTWSSTAVSKQIGAGTVLARLCSTHRVALRGIKVGDNGKAVRA